MSEGLVSILIPCYNAARWIEGCLESCARQTYRPLEIVVVDDGSTDGGADAARRWASASPVPARVAAQANAGCGAARNRAVAEARGEFLLYLDADDELEPDAAARLAAALREDPALAAAFGDLQRVDEAGREMSVRRQALDGLDPVTDVLNRAPEPSGLMMKREAAASRRFDESIRYGEGFEYFARLAIEGARFAHVPFVSLRCRLHSAPDRLSNAPAAHRNRFMARIFESLGRRLEESGRATPERRAVIQRGLLNAAIQLYRGGEREEAREWFRKVDRRAVPLAGNLPPGGLPWLVNRTNLDLGYALWSAGRLARGLSTAEAAS